MKPYPLIKFCTKFKEVVLILSWTVIVGGLFFIILPSMNFKNIMFCYICASLFLYCTDLHSNWIYNQSDQC